MAEQADAALRPFVISFDPGRISKIDHADVQQGASGPLSAAGSPGSSAVPGHRARRPPVLLDDHRTEKKLPNLHAFHVPNLHAFFQGVDACRFGT